MRPARRTAAALLALALLAPGADRADEPGWLLLGPVPTDGELPADASAGLLVTLELHPGREAKAASVREWFPEARVERDRLVLRLGPVDPTGRGAPGAAHRRASFLVDFDEPPVAALRPAVEEAVHGQPDGPALAAFVDRHVSRKSMARVLDPASVVATRREGDCSEHAVLTAALGRLLGWPARVVFGLAVLPVPGGSIAAGHAWAEVHDGRRWVQVDAVPLPPGTRRVPLAEAGEGPGSGLVAWGRLSPTDLRRVTLRSAGAPAR